MKRTLLKSVAITASVFALGLAAVACGPDNDTDDPNGKDDVYTVTYSLNDGTGTLPTETDKKAGAKFDLAPSTGFSNGDKVFDGWHDGTAKYAASAEYTMPSHAVTFTAQWKYEQQAPTVTYHVTYDLNGGSGKTPTEEDKAKGDKFKLAPSAGLTNGDKVFDNWYDGAAKYAAGAEYTMPESHVTLTAQWKELYSVTYDLNGGAGELPTEANKTEGEKFKLSAGDGLTKDGYTFDGWSDGTNKYDAEAEYTMPAQNVTLTAQWKEAPIFIPTANIALMYNDDTYTGTLMLNDDGTGYVSIYDPTDYSCVLYNDIGYIYADGQLKITSSEVVDADYASGLISTPVSGTVDGRSVSITLTVGVARYEFQNELFKMKVTNNIPNSNDIVAYYPEGLPINLTYPLDSNYEKIKVDGEEKNNAYCEAFTMPAKDVVVDYVYHVYTIVYKANDGENEDYIDYVTTPNNYTLMRDYQIGFSRDGYTLAGWTVNDSDYSQGARITLSADTTEVVARWDQLYTVSYAGVDDPSVQTNFDPETSTTQFVSSATAYCLPYGKRQFLLTVIFFTREGYTLKGWTSSADIGTADEGKIYNAGTYYTLTQDTMFTAVWEQIIYYTVTYDLGGGSGALPTETDKAEGEKFNLALGTGLTNGELVFDGWSDGTKKYAEGAEYTMPDDNVTLTAQWKGSSSGVEHTGVKTYTGTPDNSNGRITSIVIDFDNEQISIYNNNILGAVQEPKVSTLDKREAGYYVAYSDNPTGSTLWVVISDDGTTITLYDDDNGPDVQLGGIFTLQQ